jgi:uncharacterized repeat protein (TIGR01451 family)
MLGRWWRWGGLVLLVMALAGAGGGPAGAVPAAAIAVPVLKWQLGGCYASWCETGWYASAAVADLDGDGASEVVGAAYSLFILEGADGTQRRNVDPPGSRVWPGVVVADLDGDGDQEIVVATGDGYLTVLDHTGDQVWSRRPASRELRGLSAYDLDADGTLELIVTAAVGSRTNTWVYEHDGDLRAGWPQLSNDSGYAWGVFNDNAAVGDLDGDGMGEIVVPSDVHYICAYERDGAQIPAHTMYGDEGWGRVGLWESLEIELRGWGRCNGERDESYRPNFAHSPAALADVNGDGVVEVVATGNMYSCISGYPSRYYALYLLNADRSRFNDGVYDWREIPQDTGAPLVEDYNVIESVHPNPAVGDLDGDGTLEVVYPSYDGRVHAFWLDKTEHGAWPYAVHTGGPYRFASEAALADLDADGDAEVIFASWTQKGSGQTGQLHILDHLGNVVHEVDLPPAFGGASWNGALAAPTLANIDADADLEVVLNTAHSGLVAYDLPGTAGARVLWGTGRGNQARTGAARVRSLAKSAKHVAPVLAEPGETVTYTLALWNPGPVLPSVRVTDTLPLSTTHNGHLWASAGTWGVQGRVITWTGAVGDGVPVTLTYGAVISVPATVPAVLRNTALLDDGAGRVWERTALVIVNGRALYLPVVVR